jgi:hypothetical protein
MCKIKNFFFGEDSIQNPSVTLAFADHERSEVDNNDDDNSYSRLRDLPKGMETC